VPEAWQATKLPAKAGREITERHDMTEQPNTEQAEAVAEENTEAMAMPVDDDLAQDAAATVDGE
jgi:hypothetical protein